MRQSSENTLQWNKRLHKGGLGLFCFCFSLNTFVQILSQTRIDCVQFCVAYLQAAIDLICQTFVRALYVFNYLLQLASLLKCKFMHI